MDNHLKIIQLNTITRKIKHDKDKDKDKNKEWLSLYRITYNECMADCMSGPYGGTYQECKVPCSKYHGATHPTFSLKQPIPVVPSSYSYEQCMWECQSQGGYSYECKLICQQYKNPRPLYSYPVSPYSYFPMQSIF